MSKRFRLGSVDWEKIGTGLLIASGGAVATYLQQTIPNVDFSQVIPGYDITPLVVAVNSVLVNAIRKFVTDTSN